MMLNSQWLFDAVVLVATQGLLVFEESPVRDSDAVPRLIADGFEFTEGPAWDGKGALYFTDQPKDRIHRWSKDGGVEVFLEPAGRANGLGVDRDGTLLACADAKNQLWRIDSDGKKTVLVDGFDDRLLNGPNDLWIDPRGGIYFTDPFYRRSYWNRGESEQDGEHVYYMSPGRRKLVRVACGFERPNGIVGTPDGRALYVADIKAKKTYRFEIEPGSGALLNRRLFVSHGSDGMTLDAEGNIYLTEDVVLVFDPKGVPVDRIEIPQRPSNVCFGGDNGRTLFITARQAVYALSMKVQGCVMGEGGHASPMPGVQVAQSFIDASDPDLRCDYLLFLPPDYESGSPKPLMLFLHGRGESDGPLDIVKTWGPPKRVEGDPSFPFILVSPQCPRDDFWSSEKQLKILSGLLDHVIARLDVDQDRIYLTGLSMGGYGTWALAARNPERFAAIAPICGGGDPDHAERLVDLPIWAWHGIEDRVVPASKTLAMIEALEAVGTKRVRYTSLEGIGHVSWCAAYASPELYSWFEKQRRSR